MEAAMAKIYSQPHLSLQRHNDMEGDDDGSSSSGELLRGDGGITSSGGRRSSSTSSLRRRSYGDVAILNRPAGGADGALLPHGSKQPPRHASSGGSSSSSSSLRRRSYGDIAIVPAGGAGGALLLPCGSKPPLRHGNGRGGDTTDQHAAAADANLHVWTTDEHAAAAYFHVSAVPGYVSFEDVIGGAALYRDGSGRPLEAAISDPLLSTASRLYVRENNGRARQCRQPSPGPLGTRRGSTMHAIVKKYVLQGFLASIFCCLGISRDRSATETTV